MSSDSFFSRLCRPESLLDAWKQVRRKNSKGGIDGVDPEDLDGTIESLTVETATRLENRSYIPDPYREFMIPKLNDKREWRALALPAVTDKLVQQAVVDLIGPFFDKKFLDCSYAYRPGKGPVRACKRVAHILSTYRPSWVAASDIDDFFSSLPHHKLLEKLTAELDDPGLVDLISLWLRAGYINQRGDFSDPKKGIAQGAVISPLLSNAYLHELDLFAIKEEIPYVRYSDNYIIFAESKSQIERRRLKLEGFLRKELGLKLNYEARPDREIETGFAFLGIFFGPQGKSISLAKERKIVRRLNQLTDPKFNTDPFSARLRINQKIAGHKRFYGYIDPVAAFARFDEVIFKRLAFLLVAYRKSGALTSRNEIVDYCRGLYFYIERPVAERQILIQDLLDPLFKPKTGAILPARTDAASGRGHRTQSRQSHYVKELAGESEVVVSSPGVFIGKRGARMILRLNRKIIHEQPFSRLRCITVTSNGVSFSSDVVRYCTSKSIPITFYNYTGRAYASIKSPIFQSGDLSLKQVRMYANGKGLILSRKIIIAKCRSQMNLIKYYDRHRARTDPAFHDRMQLVLERMNCDFKILQAIDIKPPYAKIRNSVFMAEARVSSGYWDMVRLLLPAEVGFRKRIKRGAQDVVNVMLNYGYGILYHRVWEAVTSVSLNPEVGFLHAWQRGRPTLVYDLVEEYRQAFVDRPLFSLLTKGTSYRTLQLKAGSNLLDQETREVVLQAVLGRLATLINFRNDKIKADDIITLQAVDFAAVIAERKKKYRPYIMSY